jgi:hypothetical protein
MLLSALAPYARTLDSTMLIYTTFYLGNIWEKEDNVRPALLSLYFTSRKMRAIFYLGCSLKLSYNWLFLDGESRHSRILGAGMLLLTSILNFPKLFPSSMNATYGSWQSVATDSTGFLGSWWAGVGDGEWFAFLGHNGSSEKTIIPISILEQMSVQKTPFDGNKDNSVIIEEVTE